MSDQIGTASIGLAVDSSGVDAGLNRMEASVTQTARSLSTLGRRGAEAVEGIGSGARTAADNTERATRRIQNEIQRTTAVAQAGERGTRAYYEAIANQRGANLNALRPYLDQLEQVRAAQQAATQAALRNGAAFQNNAQSAAQLAANLRVVPAQLTDIVTSLQGGQQPLTVLLQQGGQLRDMFGSIGGAARALGGYIFSLITPLTLVAAAAAALAVAYNQGSKESEAFRRSIITTGNAAGVTTSQLAALAKQGSATAGTVGAQADALAQLVGTGKVGADQLGKASTSALQAQKFLGIAVEDTVKNFAELGKAPLQASLKLNDSMNYLTESTYQQIRALELQGKTSEAAKVAQDAYSAATLKQTKDVEAGLGLLSRAWNGVGSAAKGAWDFMLNVGRESTIDEQLQKAEAALKLAQKRQTEFIGTPAEKQAAVDDAQYTVDRLKNIRKVQQVQAESDAAAVKQFAAARANEEEAEKYLTRREQQERAIAKAREVVTAAAPRGQDPAETEEAVQKRIAQIRASFADLNNQGIESQIAAVERLGQAQELAAQRAKLILQGDNSAGFNQSFDKQDQYITAVAQAEENALRQEKARLQQRLALTAQETVSEDNKFAQQQKLADLRGQIANKEYEIGTRQKQLTIDLRNEDIARTKAAFAGMDTLLDAREADTQALREQLQAQQDQNAALGLTGQALQDFNTRLAEERATRLELKADIADTILGREEEAEELRKQAQLVRDLNTAQIQGANKAAAIEANKTFWESVDRAAQSAFTNIFDGGKSAFDRLADTLKTGLLDVLYQLTVKKFIINLSAQATGAALTPQQVAENQFYDATGYKAGNNAIGNVANALNLYKLTSSAGTAITAAGNLFGSSAVSAFGAGLSGGAGITEAAAAYAAAGQSTIATALSSGAQIGSFISTALPYVAAAFVGYKVLDSLFSDGPEQNTKLTFGSNNAAGNISINMRGNEGKSDSYIGKSGTSAFGTFGTTQSLWTSSDSAQVQNFIKAVTQTDDALASFLTTTEKASVTAALTNIRTTVNTGPEGGDQNVNGGLDQVFQERIKAILAAVQPGLQQLVDGFKGTSAELANEAQALLTYRTALDKSGEALFGTKVTLQDIAALKQPTETVSAAIKRISDEFTATNAAAAALGKSTVEAFGALGLASEDARKNLILAVGGVDQLSSQTAFFAQNFLSDTERLKPVTEALNQAFASLNLAVPKTRDEFAALVRSYDPASTEGQKMIASLLGVQEAFAETHPQIDATTEALSKQKEQRSLDIQLMQALGNEEGALAATRADALKALLSDQARITQAQIYAAQDAKKVYDSLVSVADGAFSRLQASVKAEQDGINAAYNTQAQAIRDATSASVKSAQDSLKAAQDQANAIQTVFNALDSALGSTQIQSDAATAARRQAAQGVLRDALANPSTLANNKALTDALGTITNQSNERLFGTFEEYARDQARTNNAIYDLKSVAGEQVDNAALTVKRLGDSIDAIQTASDKQLQQLRTDTDEQLNKLDMQLATASQQLDALKGINSAILTLADAQSVFTAAITNLSKNQTAQQNATVGDKVQNLYETLLKREGTTAEVEYWKNLALGGLSFDEIRYRFVNSDEYKALQKQVSALSGANQAIGADQAAALMARVSDPTQNATALLAELQRLNELTQNQQTTLDAIAESTGIAGDVLDKAQKGQPLATEAV
jgi:phage-related minor tail protein